MNKFLFLLVFCVVICVVIGISPVYASLSTGLVYHWSLEDNSASTNVVESVTGFNMTASANTNGLSVAGIHGNGLNLDTANRIYTDYIFNRTGPFWQADMSGANTTIDFWYYQNTAPGAWAEIMSYYNSSSGANRRFEFTTAGDNNWNLYAYPPPEGCEITAMGLIQGGTWNHVTISKNPHVYGEISFYINGKNVRNASCSRYYGDVGNSRIYFNQWYDSTGDAHGRFDEISMWNRTLNVSEVLDLNSTFYPFTAPGVLTCNYNSPTPANDDHDNVNITINVSCSNIGDTILYFDTVNPPITQAINGSMVADLSYTTNIHADDDYFYYAWCTDGFSTATSAVRRYILDTEAPTIILNPTNFFNSTNGSKVTDYSGLTNATINVTLLHTDTALYGFEFNITHPNGTVMFAYRTESLNGSSRWNYTSSFNFSSWQARINYSVDIWGSDSHTDEEIPHYWVSKSKSKIDFTVQTGNIITISTKDSSDFKETKLKDRYTLDLTFDAKGKKDRELTLKTTSCPLTYLPFSKYRGHFVSFCGQDGNWIDFEGMSSVSVVKISNYEYKLTFSNLYDAVKMKSIGGLNIRHETYHWYLPQYPKVILASQENQMAITPIVQEDTLKGICNQTAEASTVTIYSKFYLNGTEILSSSGNFVSRARTNAFNVSPFLVAGSLYTYSCKVYDSFLGANSSWANSTTVTPQSLSISPCTSGNTTLTIFSRIEDTPNTALNVTLEIDGVYYTNPAVNYTFNASFPLNTTFSLCVYPAWANMTALFWLKYVNPNSFTQHYYLVKEILNNNTQTLYIFSLNDTLNKNILKITARNINDYTFMSEIYVQLQRRYVAESVWRTVQMAKTGDFGLLNFNIYERTQQYRLIYMDANRNILKTTSLSSYICPSSTTYCEYTQLLNPYSSTTSTQLPVVNSTFFNASKMVYTDWTNPDGSISLVVSKYRVMRLNSVTDVCTTSQLASAGSTSCNMSGYSGVVQVMTTSDGILAKIQNFQIPSTTLKDHLTLKERSFYSFLLALPIIMVGIFSPIGVIVFAILALIVISLLGILDVITIGFIAVAVVVGLYLGTRLQK